MLAAAAAMFQSVKQMQVSQNKYKCLKADVLTDMMYVLPHKRCVSTLQQQLCFTKGDQPE